jgi:hypothetical protein
MKGRETLVRWEAGNIKTDYRGIECEDLNWTEQAQHMVMLPSGSILESNIFTNWITEGGLCAMLL